MVLLGRANSRMKDIYDIWLLAKSYSFEGDSLARAIAATFARRETAIPAELPDALTPSFAEDPAKVEQMGRVREGCGGGAGFACRCRCRPCRIPDPACGRGAGNSYIRYLTLRSRRGTRGLRADHGRRSAQSLR